ncbi:MAG: type II toxin-antitoxin system HicB family antitoxin [Xanthomonadales bacterium]|jgi:predicted RNase H-like HicB family nuclease|nr:type II toxin-antitoxin system HicB family antitoxin [Xanthomonadales bacterium]
MNYVVIIEKTQTGYSAYLPDLPGCIAAATTQDEVMRLLNEAVPDHIQLMREHGETIPEPSTEIRNLEIAAESDNLKSAPI